MFSPGSEILVLASSETHTGPRRGSLGFVSWYEIIDNHEELFIKACHKAFPSISYPIMIQCGCHFYRFGFEKKHRCERKLVSAVFPIYNSEFPENEVRKGARDFQRAVDGNYGLIKEHKTRLRNFGAASIGPMAILAPTNHAVKFNSKSERTEACLHSIVRNWQSRADVKQHSDIMANRLGLSQQGLFLLGIGDSGRGCAKAFVNYLQPREEEVTKTIISRDLFFDLAKLTAHLKNERVKSAISITTHNLRNMRIPYLFVRQYIHGISHGQEIYREFMDNFIKQNLGGKEKTRFLNLATNIGRVYDILTEEAAKNL